MDGAAFAAAHLLLIVAGLPAMWLPGVREFRPAARLAAAFGTGAVVVTIVATILSAFEIRWSWWTLGVPAVVASVGATLWVARRATHSVAPTHVPPAWTAALLCGGVILLSLTHLVAMLLTTRSTSMDFLYFWGVKAVRFAEFRGIDPDLLRWVFFSHAVPDYPPLVPVIQALCSRASDGMPWIQAPVASAWWFVATIPLLFELLSRRVASGAMTVIAFWCATLAVSLAHSYSGGNAEAPLVFFETAAVVALLSNQRAFAAVMLTGAVLTKVEGTVGTLLLVAGAILRDVLTKERAIARRAALLILPPALALGTWFFFQWRHDLQIGFRSHGPVFGLHTEHLQSILTASFANLSGGAAGLGWIIPAVTLILTLRRRTAVDLLPVFTFVIGAFGFFLFEYMHDATDPTQRIGWTLPRISQPALSLLIIGAGISAFAPRETRHG